MYLTEKEAKGKWCPMARLLPEENYASFNRPIESEFQYYGDKPNCIASECMAWRESVIKERGEVAKGYCGLAGKPG